MRRFVVDQGGEGQVSPAARARAEGRTPKGEQVAQLDTVRSDAWGAGGGRIAIPTPQAGGLGRLAGPFGALLDMTDANRTKEEAIVYETADGVAFEYRADPREPDEPHLRIHRRDPATGELQLVETLIGDAQGRFRLSQGDCPPVIAAGSDGGFARADLDRLAAADSVEALQAMATAARIQFGDGTGLDGPLDEARPGPDMAEKGPSVLDADWRDAIRADPGVEMLDWRDYVTGEPPEPPLILRFPGWREGRDAFEALGPTILVNPGALDIAAADPEPYERLQKALEAAAIDVNIVEPESRAFWRERGWLAHTAQRTDNPERIIINILPEADRSAVLEEIIHAVQIKTGRQERWLAEYGNANAARLASEVDAARKLAALQRALEIPDSEHAQTLVNLEYYLRQMRKKDLTPPK